MTSLSHPNSSSGSTIGTDVLALAPAPVKGIMSRRRVSRTNLGKSHTVRLRNASADTNLPELSIVTRRHAAIRRRRRKRILIGIALLLCVFPPMWGVYLISWLVWRTRPRQQSMRRVRKAVRALGQNHTGVALRQLQEAHYRDPANNDALYWLGLLLSQQQRHEEAEEALSLVAERVPGLPEVEAALAEAYLAMDDSDNAIHHAQRLLDVAPHDPLSLLTLARAFEAADKLDLAIQTLEQAPIHKRTLTDALVQIHYHLGILYQKQDNPAQALHHFTRVYARDITFRDVKERVRELEGEKA